MTEQTHKLYRSRDDRMIGGVCGGLGDFFGMDPTLIRLLFVLLTLFGGSGILVYIFMWLIVPEELQLASPAPGTDLATAEGPEEEQETEEPQAEQEEEEAEAEKEAAEPESSDEDAKSEAEDDKDEEPEDESKADDTDSKSEE